MSNLPRGLIVSCQAVQGETLYGYGVMNLMAKCAKDGGAVGIRANYVNDIMSIKKEVDLPIIGIIKAVYDGSDVYITPTLKEVKDLINTGCEVIALDCTNRARPNGEKLEDLVKYIRENAPNVEIMADTADFNDAENADKLGFDYIGTTMRGYTAYTKSINIPDYDFITKLVKEFPNRKIIAEGGVWEREQLKKVCDCGVYAVVIGTAITRPTDITKRFVEVMELK